MELVETNYDCHFIFSPRGLCAPFFVYLLYLSLPYIQMSQIVLKRKRTPQELVPSL